MNFSTDDFAQALISLACAGSVAALWLCVLAGAAG